MINTTNDDLEDLLNELWELLKKILCEKYGLRLTVRGYSQETGFQN